VIDGSAVLVELLDDVPNRLVVVDVVNNDVRYDGMLPMVDIDSGPGFNRYYRLNGLT